MTTVDGQDQPHIVGYGDRLSVQPGDSVSFLISCDFPEYDVEFVRLSRGEDADGRAGVRESGVLPQLRRRCPGRRQRTWPGSFVRVPEVGPVPHAADRLQVALWFLPTKLSGDRVQCLVNMMDPDTELGWELVVDADNRLEYRIGTRRGVDGLTLTRPLRVGRWYAVLASHDRADGIARLRVQERGCPEVAESVRSLASGEHARGAPSTLLIGARPGGRGGAGATAHLNGRVEDVRLHQEIATAAPERLLDDEPDGDLLFWWDFSVDVHTAAVRDRGPSGRHGRTVNMPTRAVAGHRWNGDHLSFRAAPEHYGALHLHEDDLDDAAWDVDFVLDVPANLPSGVYAAKCSAGGQVGHVVFVVTPLIGRPRAPVVVVLPTFTYQAYANNRVALERDFLASGLVGRAVREDPYLDLLGRHPEWGKSLYDVHADGSGVVHSSRLRPMLNLRPDYTHWISGGPRNFSADLCLLHWLDTLGFDADVITDEQLHRSGLAAIAPYRVVLTGSHPEYCTSAMLTALTRYRDHGGRLMYLGGNGFYWVTSTHGEQCETVEVRRGHSGTRPWTSAVGEADHAATGEPGGLWRHRGRSPNALVGVGFTAQGWDEAARPYVRLPAAFEPRFRWIFAGLRDDEVIGDFGLVMDGAAGDEIDRHDPRIAGGDAVVLARSAGHSAHYCLAIEDQEQATPDAGGGKNELVRADLVHLDVPGGGAVFSVGSMAWVGSLPVNNCDNNVSTVTANVLYRFLSLDVATSGRRSVRTHSW